MRHAAPSLAAAAAAALLLLAPCGGKGPPAQTTPALPQGAAPDAAPAAAAPERLVPDAELAQIEARAAAAVADHAGRACRRPVLRGPAAAGPAAPDIAALVDAADLGGCAQAVDGAGDALRAALESCTSPRPEEATCEPRPLDDPASMTDAVKAVEAACAAVPAAFAGAAGHEDACSPYRPGARGWKPGDVPAVIPFMRLVRGLSIEARARARAGKPAEALRMVFDGIRVAQDLGRGGTGLLLGMVSVAEERVLADTASAILASARLTPAELGALAVEVDALLASEVPAGEHFAGEAVWGSALVGAMLAEIRAGGRPEESPQGLEGLDSLDVIALLYLASNARMEAAAEACAAGQPVKVCFDALAAEEGKPIEPGADSPRAPAFARARQQVAATPLARYARNVAGAYAHLAALRVQVEHRRQTARARRCPDVETLRAGPLAALLAPAGLGDALGLEAAADGAAVVVAPAWLGRDGKPARLARLECAKKKAK